MRELQKNICEQIREHGPIPFVDFMQQALYAPIHGYYSSGLQKFGKGGDFITAPELTPLFAQTLANQCQQVFSQLWDANLFEFGAGSGRLCVDLLTALENLNALPQKYFILEVSEHLKKRQQELIANTIPHLQDKVTWVESWPATPFNGVVIANEILDAMPVHRFLQTENELLESCIELDKDESFHETFLPCTNNFLQEYVKSALPQGLYPYLSEANLFVNGWLDECFAMLDKGVVLLIDYGFPRHEYYHPDRNQGTLMCHYQHLAHPNPFINVGEQDITAHVDFTQVAMAAADAGFHVAGFSNQASFLLSSGLLELSQRVENTKEHTKNMQAIQQLTSPSEMGELFKVMALSKQVDIPLMGFLLQDKRGTL